MLSGKKNILILAALLRKHAIKDAVLCPGSRNAPIVHTLTTCGYFNCYPVTDERSAGFFALGLSIQSGKPVVVVCTSGSALLNLHPAVAEAFYQQIPLIIISADRPAAWIGQMDGQTLPQPGVFGPLVKCSVSLPEGENNENEWYVNRLINEALLELNHHGLGPVHINMPVSEPLFNFTIEKLPDVRMVNRYGDSNTDSCSFNDLVAKLKRYGKRMIIAGQENPSFSLGKLIAPELYQQFIWLSEVIGNQYDNSDIITNFDALLYTLSDEEAASFVPDILITFGGHIVSKRLKKWLRQHPPKEHWHIAANGKVVDLFGALTTIIEMDAFTFFHKLSGLLGPCTTDYSKQWKKAVSTISEPLFSYSEMSAIGALITTFPSGSVLHLANSSAVRYAQLFRLPADTTVCCNRGVNGIEGSLSAAVGYSSKSSRLNFVVIGDLSFFYDMNALWNNNIGTNLRILLLNNRGGEIFNTLPGLDASVSSHSFIAATHGTSARGWAEERQFCYLHATNEKELTAAMKEFIDGREQPHSMLLEVFTDQDRDSELLKAYYHQLKK
jgi:2-succinyl-5-enolpyruvyl-6-hydroxy-3-cyclohexene-1-carboxylate synthase